MTINKYTGKTKDEAILAAKQELGENIVIMNAKNKKPEGIFGIFKASIWEVTAAIEDDTDGSVSLLGNKEPFKPMPTSTFNAVVDDKIDLAENELKSAFREISKVVEIAEEKNELHTNVIKAKDIKPKVSESATPVPEKKIEEPVEQKPIEKRSDTAPVRKQVAEERAQKASKIKDNNLPVVRMIYNTLIENEVDEKYINQVFDDIGNILSSSISVDFLISNVYQKLVLKMGTPRTISLSPKKPTVVFFVGPTGVGKTTTIAKIASKFKLEENKRVAFVTADTYRIAATDQLSTYADILGSPISVVYSPEELNPAIEGLKDQDIILVDTVGFSHRNEEQRQSTKALLEALDEKYKKEIFLVLSVTTKYADLREISDSYRDICDYNLIFTKLDETNTYGNILNIHCHSKAELSYVTTGQSVPDDIETIDSQKLVKSMLGGR